LADEESESEFVYSDDDADRRNKFLALCRQLREKVAVVEAIQIDILIMLLTDDDDASSEVWYLPVKSTVCPEPYITIHFCCTAC